MSVSLLAIVALVALWGQSVLFRRRGLKRLDYRRQFDRDFCVEGDMVEMQEHIVNDKALPLPWLRLEALLSSGLQFVSQENLSIASGARLQNHRSLFSLWGYTEVIRQHKVRCVRRGCYDLETVTLSCGDLFGISQTVRTDRVNQRLLVYPRSVPVEELPLPWRGWQGEFAVKRWMVEDPYLMLGVREYRSGDSLRSIHWKATSRTGQLQVREHGYTADRRLMILLNIAEKEDMWAEVNEEALMEWGIRCVLTLVEQALAEGMPVGFGCNAPTVDEPEASIRLAPGAGNVHHKQVLDAMAQLKLEQQVHFAEYLRLEGERHEESCDYVLISAYTSPLLEEQMLALEEQGSKVLLLPLERERVAGEKQQAGAPPSGASADHAQAG